MKKWAALFLLFFILFCAASFATDESTATGNKISLNLKGAPLSSVLYALGKEAGLNIVSPGAIKGNVSISVNDVSALEALIAVLKSAGCNYTIEGNIIRVDNPQAKMEEEISSKDGIVTKAFETDNVLADDARDAIQKMDYPNTKVLSTKGTNIIIVEAPVKALDVISKLIKKLNATPNQVIVESKIMEITMGNGATPSTFGVNMNYQGVDYSMQTEGFANPAAVGVPGFYAHVVKDNLESYIQALEHQEGYNLLASPKIMAISGKTASIISGSKLGYKTTLTTTTGTSQNVDFLEVGTKLEFTPYISDDGTIRMDIHPEVSEGSITVDGLPQKNTTEATTTVILHDGESIIIGGLIKNKSTETTNGVPIIMNIPFIGNFFRSKQLTWQKDEIIAVLTPHIINNKKIQQMSGEIENFNTRQNDKNKFNGPDLMWWVK